MLRVPLVTPLQTGRCLKSILLRLSVVLVAGRGDAVGGARLHHRRELLGKHGLLALQLAGREALLVPRKARSASKLGQKKTLHRVSKILLDTLYHRTLLDTIREGRKQLPAKTSTAQTLTVITTEIMLLSVPAHLNSNAERGRSP